MLGVANASCDERPLELFLKHPVKLVVRQLHDGEDVHVERSSAGVLVTVGHGLGSKPVAKLLIVDVGQGQLHPGADA